MTNELERKAREIAIRDGYDRDCAVLAGMRWMARQVVWIADERARQAQGNKILCAQDGDLDGVSHWNGIAKGERDLADIISARFLTEKPEASNDLAGEACPRERPSPQAPNDKPEATTGDATAGVSSHRPPALSERDAMIERAEKFAGPFGYGRAMHILRVMADFVLAETEALRRELDAYKQAKAENDERFITERNDARSERDAALAEIARAKEQTK